MSEIDLPMQTQQPRIFFPGLNILRFYAAVAVIYDHIVERSNYPGLSHYPNLLQPISYLLPSSGNAVTLFFVISGFLITYLLLAERERTGTIAVGKFYIRRILRIWPLYYLIVFFAFFVMPTVFGPNNVVATTGFVFNASDPDFWAKFLFFFFLLPNIPFAYLPTALPAAHLWSIGVEEQFYLIWPWLVRRFKRRLGWVIYGIILFKLVAEFILAAVVLLPGDHHDRLLASTYLFARDWRLEAMAAGAYGAYILFLNKEWLLRIIFHPVVKYGSAAIFIWHVLFYSTLRPAEHFLLTVLYTIVLMNIAANPKPLFRLENRVTGFLGNISYGLYVYHVFVLLAILHVFQDIGYSAAANPLVFNIVLYTLTLSLSILVAGLSYRFFETPFLRLKSRFAIVRSGSTAAPALQPEIAPVTDAAI